MKAIALILVATTAAYATEFHVSINGDDTNGGTAAKPFRTISAAAQRAQPGDVITVHAGVYRERVDPPRGGESDEKRITYQAAPGEKVAITGSEIVRGWTKVSGNTWQVTIPNKFFGGFNPYGEIIHGDWFNPLGRTHHRGAVYLNGDWLTEAANLNDVLAPAGPKPLWFGKMDGGPTLDNLVNIAWLKTTAGVVVSAVKTSAKHGTQPAACSEGGQCVGFIRGGDWLRYDGVDLGEKTDAIQLRVAAKSEPSEIEVRLDGADGELLGTANVTATGDWQKWTTVTVNIKPISGKHNLCLVIKPPHVDAEKTTIWAQFKDVNPNEADVEINVRPTVFTPTKPFINYITLRGFILKNAATNWASPSEGQVGLVTAYWCKGWIIENNEVCYSRCAGITLGKMSDAGDGKNYGTGGFYSTIKEAQTDEHWDKEHVGSHLVKGNHIHHCEQAGIDGSLGAIYSRITGNVIHDIYTQRTYDGAEQAGIKFHAAVDAVIEGNHIYRTYRGMWLDWMTQGTQVRNNFLHDNDLIDLTLEASHGPLLIANNIFASGPAPHWALLLNAQNSAVTQNLFANRVEECGSDGRHTPYFKPHTTETMGMAPAGPGNSFYFNNLFFSTKQNSLPASLEGNVFWSDPNSAAKDKLAIKLAPEANPQFKVLEKPDGWYIQFVADANWDKGPQRRIVTTDLLGKATLSGQVFENGNGSAYRIDTDYFGGKRDAEKPFPGPFEIKQSGEQEIKVWPVM